MGSRFILQQKHKNIPILTFMGTMCYSKVTKMVDLTSKWEMEWTFGLMELHTGLLVIGLHIINQMYFAPISLYRVIGNYSMENLIIKQKKIFI